MNSVPMTALKREIYQRIKKWSVKETRKAIRKGLIPRLRDVNIRCMDCKVNRATQYDHRDYEKPLEVQPVCGGCNNRRGMAKIPK